MNVHLGSINRSSRAVVMGAVASSFVYFCVIPCVFAQAASNVRLVDYATPSRPPQSTAIHLAIQTNETSVAEAKGRDPGENIIKPTNMTAADRWIKFESEYGIEQESPSPIGRMFQVAKYGLDRMTFSAQETAKRFEFTYDLGSESANDPANRAIAPQYSLPMFGRFGRAQFKSEVTIHDPQTGEAFIGLKLAIPFGQGG
jgi:hypothetical protein